MEGTQQVATAAALSGISKLDRLKSLVRDHERATGQIERIEQLLSRDYGLNNLGDARVEVAKIEEQAEALREWTDPR